MPYLTYFSNKLDCNISLCFTEHNLKIPSTQRKTVKDIDKTVWQTNIYLDWYEMTNWVIFILF